MKAVYPPVLWGGTKTVKGKFEEIPSGFQYLLMIQRYHRNHPAGNPMKTGFFSTGKGGEALLLYH